MRILFNALIFLFEKIQTICYPQCCLLCGKQHKKNICPECQKEINKNINVIVKKYKEREIYYDKHIYFFKYEDIIRNKIIDYKFNDKSYLYKLFSEIIIKNKKVFGILKSYDIIIPVPIHKKRKKERGYNQCELITNDIAKYLELKSENNNLIKIKNTVPQSSLDKVQRIQNTKNVYKVLEKDKILNKNIILFDDIYTTGNTVNECSKILKENGAKKILVFTIAKD